MFDFINKETEKLMGEVSTFLKSKGFKFHSMKIEDEGNSKYLKVTLSIKVK